MSTRYLNSREDEKLLGYDQPENEAEAEAMEAEADAREAAIDSLFDARRDE